MSQARARRTYPLTVLFLASVIGAILVVGVWWLITDDVIVVPAILASVGCTIGAYITNRRANRVTDQ